MAIQERLTKSQAENIITILAHSDEYGKLVAQLVRPELFEGEYRVIAERCVEYWRQHGEAPKVHTPDLVAEILDDPHNRRAGTFRRILAGMSELSEGINANYVLRQLKTFTRLQELKDAILRSAEALNSPVETTVEQVESILADILRARDFHFDPGIRLGDIHSLLDYLDTHYSEFSTGVRHLDERYIVPARSQLLMFVAPSGYGKTWFLVNMGKRAILSRKRVLHLSYEVDALDVQQRYFQSLFAIPKRESEIKTTVIKTGRSGEITGITSVDVEPDFHFKSEYLKDELEARINILGERTYSNLVIKRFPPRSMTPDGVRGYLDSLEATEGFIPDMILFDAPYLLRTDPKNHRISLGRNVEEVRAIAIERDAAMVAVHQSSKEGATSRQVRGTHVAEDWSIIATSDIIVTHSATDMERHYGLARLFVDKARTEQDKFGVLITQNYSIGQFALSSARLSDSYYDYLESLKEKDDEDEEGMSDDEEE